MVARVGNSRLIEILLGIYIKAFLRQLDSYVLIVRFSK